MIILYDIGLFLFYLLLVVASFFNQKARKWVVGRNSLLKKLKKTIHNNEKVMWMHCSSLGEFEQGRPVLEKFRLQYPDYKIVLSFFSPSGYEIRKNYEFADYVTYLPLDTWINARRFIKILHPDIVFFIKYDFWYHHLKQAKKHGAHMYLVSAAFNSKQVFFKWYGGFFRSMLKTFTRFFVQNNESEKLLHRIGLNDVMVTGDTRIDRVRQIAQHAERYEKVKEFVDEQPCLVCGSTWQKDEEIIREAYTIINKRIKLIIAPHLIDEQHIIDIEKLFSTCPTIRYTKIAGQPISQYSVLIVDTIGMLSSLYNYGQVAYIGGGFEDGIHNILEAVVFGIPVVFGPHYDKFIEANELIVSGGAKSIRNGQELTNVLNNWYDNPDAMKKVGKTAGNYILKQQNATDIILENL